MSPSRYTIGFTPETNTDLARFGNIVYRNCKYPNTNFRYPEMIGPDKERWKALVMNPEHSCFHGTLTAPFSLNTRNNEAQLLSAVEQLAGKLTPCSLSTLEVHLLSGFAALMLKPFEQKQVTALANTCVKKLAPFKGSNSKSDITIPQQSTLTRRENRFLEKYGYPHFHMILSKKLTNQDMDYLEWLHTTYTDVVRKSPVLDNLSVFYQEDKSTALKRVCTYKLAHKSELLAS